MYKNIFRFTWNRIGKKNTKITDVLLNFKLSISKSFLKFDNSHIVLFRYDCRIFQMCTHIGDSSILILFNIQSRQMFVIYIRKIRTCWIFEKVYIRAISCSKMKKVEKLMSAYRILHWILAESITLMNIVSTISNVSATYIPLNIFHENFTNQYQFG